MSSMGRDRGIVALVRNVFKHNSKPKAILFSIGLVLLSPIWVPALGIISLIALMSAA